MRYDEFRDQLQNALQDVGLFRQRAPELEREEWIRRLSGPIETIELSSTLRRWKMHVSGPSSPNAEPFHVSAKLDFAWDPFDAARSYLCEEDLLTELLGKRKLPSNTAQRFARVELELHATLPYGSTAPIPGAQTFAAWILSVRQKLEKILKEHNSRQRRLIAVLGELGGLGEVEIRTRCDARGSLSLNEVSVEGFRMVRVPRAWEDPDRQAREKGADAELHQLAQRFRKLLDEWTASVAELARCIRYTPPPPLAMPVKPRFDDLVEDDENGGPGRIH